MLKEEIQKIIDELRHKGRMIFREGAAPEEICAFETANGVTLPEQYKEWLMISDGGDFFLPAGIQFYGVAHKPVIDVTEDDRPSDSYIVIGALANGDPVLCEKGNERISIFNQEAGRIEADETYPDFIAFLQDMPKMLGIEE